MTNEFDGDDNWLNFQPIQCRACGEELLIGDHSPFEDSYYLYCDSCPRRVDVSVYDKHFQKIEEQLKASGMPYKDDEWLTVLLQAVSARLAACLCGGCYHPKAKPRCLYCAAEISEVQDGQNVWFSQSFDDDAPEDIHKDVIVEPMWKPTPHAS